MPKSVCSCHREWAIGSIFPVVQRPEGVFSLSSQRGEASWLCIAGSRNTCCLARFMWEICRGRRRKKRNFCLTKLPERLNVTATNPPVWKVGFAEFLQDTGSLPDRIFFLSRKISHVCRIFLYLLFARKEVAERIFLCIFPVSDKSFQESLQDQKSDFTHRA